MGCCCSEPESRVSSLKANNRSTGGNGDLAGERTCTDVFFLFLFNALVIFLITSVGIAFARGNPRRLIYGVDSYGNLCGTTNEPIDKVPQSGKDKTKEKFLVMDYCTGTSCITNKTCQASCPENYYPTTIKRCLPKSLKNAENKIQMTALTYLEEVGNDVSLSWPHILLLCGISIGLSVVLMFVFRYCASIIIWAVLIIVAFLAIALTIFLWFQWDSKRKEISQLDPDIPGRDLQENRVTYWLIAAIVATIFTVIYLLIVLIMRSRISLVAALFQEAGKAIGSMPFLLIQPIWTFLASALVCFFVLFGFVFLQSSGVPYVHSNGQVTFPNPTFFDVVRWFLLFGFFWMIQMVVACQHLVIAGSVVNWYFTRDKKNLSSPIMRSLSNTVRFHLGSAAMGSMIIALVQLIRFLFKMLQKYVGDKGERCEILWKMLQCCLACFEAYLKFLSRNAYIMIAMFGDSFCPSARKAFALLSANFMRLAALESIGDFVLFVGKIGITVAIAFIGLEVVKDIEGLHYVWIPVGISCIFALLLCHCFLSVYEMVIDSLLLCFCEDIEKNDGLQRPYYMSRSLMAFIENSRKNGNGKVNDVSRR